MKKQSHKLWRQRRGRKAMTLIELIVSLTLLSFLLIGTLGIVGRLSAHVRLSSSRMEGEPWQLRFQQLLQRDLANASQLELTATRITLEGHGSVLTTGNIATHRPARVVYEILALEGMHWTVRRETLLDSTSNKNTTVNVVCQGGSAFELYLHGSGKPAESYTGRVPELFRLALRDERGQDLLRGFKYVH